MKRRLLAGLMLAVFGGMALLPSAWADGHGRWGGRDHGERGHWEQGWHDGHLGWWWVLGSAWLLYNATHPAPPAYMPPAVIVQTPPPTPAAPSPGYWYFCGASGMYYPYVQNCASSWQPVPATPPAPAPGGYNNQ
jgi:hypothetical protein